LPHGIQDGRVKLVVGEVLAHFTGDLDLSEGFPVAPPNMPDSLVARAVFVSKRPSVRIKLGTADFFNKSVADIFNSFSACV
jgi:hypothetical protein